MGSPLIVPAHTVKEGQANDPIDYFISNRVVAGHLGVRGQVYNWNLSSKLTFAKHYGTFATSIHGKSTGGRWHEPHEEKFVPVSQFSGFVEAERELPNDFFFGIRLAVDQGALFNNSVGGQVSLRKFFRQK